ncbi:TadE family protein [Pseudomonas sp. WS 5013]|uniref:TadE/TadG family type IV pilus assembly protein n=1 Tax=Pseudomonas sp. WS 5013 TaxID=2717475 RepID=UPI0021CCB071|nr:TadE family protein [Pseudomonas sp. WS 5013]
MSKQRMNACGQRGLAMVEFAIALPLLVLMLLGIAEFGRLLYQYNTLLQASRDAGRYAAGEAWNATLGQVELGSTLQTRIKNVALYGAPSNTGSPVVAGLDADDVSVVAVGTNHVRVSITYVFQPAIGNALVNPFGDDIPLNLTLTSSVVMRAL